MGGSKKQCEGRDCPLGPHPLCEPTRGTVIHGGRQLATAEARIVGPDGKLYAHATTTCMVFDMPAPGAA
jgi:hypothetical protein